MKAASPRFSWFKGGKVSSPANDNATLRNGALHRQADDQLAN
jgi:hypothetical protein